MYKAFSEVLASAEKIGEIKSVDFHTNDDLFYNRGANISGITADGDEFTVSLIFKKAATDAD